MWWAHLRDEWSVIYGRAEQSPGLQDCWVDLNQTYRLRIHSYLGVSSGTIERGRQAFLSHVRPQIPQAGNKGVLNNARPRSRESGLSWICSRFLWRAASPFHGGRELGTSTLRASGTTLSETAVQVTVFGPGCKWIRLFLLL